MSSIYPLYVCVAKALGWTELVECPPPLAGMDPMWLGKPPLALRADDLRYVAAIDHVARTMTMGEGSIPRYDTDWRAMGPVIERLGIHIGCIERPIVGRSWWAADNIEEQAQYYEEGMTPLLAVCRLILAQYEAGRLTTVR